jgi:O-antigen/teichoic acid export membrane protein
MQDSVEELVPSPSSAAGDRSRLTLRGIASNWTALGFGFVVAFFLSPFVVHHLGNVAYGVWTLVVSVSSYMGLMDLGLRGGVIRFVSRSHAQGDHAESSRVASASLWLYLCIGLTTVLVSLLVSSGIHLFFHIPANMQVAARWAIILAGVNLASTFIFSVFGGVLAALRRYDLLSGVSIIQTAIRAVGVVWVLRSGYGILGLAICEFAFVLFRDLLMMAICFRVYPQLRISLRAPARQTLKKFWSYSSYLFLSQLCGQIIYYTDNIVVGALISVAAVTFYAIGGSLIEYLRQILISMTGTFMPLTGSLEARGEGDKLRRLLVEGTRFSFLLSLPIVVALFFRGETFIRLWMGAQYGPISGRVLRILLLAQVFAIANSTTVNMVFGLGKHQRPTLWAAGEAVANLSLSIVLSHHIGVYGVAVGTLIPRVLVNVLLWPRYICKIVDMKLRRYLWQSWIRPVSAAVPFAIACWLADRYWPAEGLAYFFLQIAGLLPVYVLAVGLSFRREITQEWRAGLKWFSRSSSTPLGAG